MVRNLKRLHEKGRISKISFRFYSFQPTFHFMVIDGKSIYFGLYKLSDKHASSESQNSYIARNNSVEGLSIISDFKVEFENIWNEYEQQQSS